MSTCTYCPVFPLFGRKLFQDLKQENQEFQIVHYALFFFLEERLILGLRLHVLIVFVNLSLKCAYDVVKLPVIVSQ